MSERTKHRIWILSIAAAVIAAGLAIAGWARAFALQNAQQEQWRRCSAQLSADLSVMNADLSKLSVCQGSESLACYAANLWAHATAAELSLEGLPLSGTDCAALESYLNRVGDYAYALVRRSATGGTLREEERESLSSLARTCGTVCAALQDPASQSFDPAYFRARAGGLSGLAEAAQALQADFPEAPVLIYDGPWSDHVLTEVPACIRQNPEPLTAEQAAAAAAERFSLSPDALTLIGECTGRIPAWCFTLPYGDGEMSLQVAKAGGGILLACSDRAAGDAKLSREEALAAAGEHAARLGFSGLASTYSYEEGGVLYVNFAYADGDILCYPDLVQVGVSLSDGGLCYAEAAGYLANHAPRSLAPTLTPAQARERLYSGFSLSRTRLCVIPTGGLGQRLCYEFLCTAGDAEYLVYIDAANGSEALILQLLYSDAGTLTM